MPTPATVEPEGVVPLLRWSKIYREAELYKAAVRIYTKPLFLWRKALQTSTDGKTLYASGGEFEVVHAFDFDRGLLANHREIRVADEKSTFVVGGLATDYCVKATALDAIRLGYQAAIILDAIRPVDLAPGDGDRALAELAAAGVSALSRSVVR